VGKALTLRMRSRSLVTYARTTLIATRRPLCVPRDISAKPPDATSTVSSEQSEMCMDVGITRCRLHVLQSLLINCSRSRPSTVSFSRLCRSCQPSMSILGKCGKLTSFISLTRFWISGSVSRRNWKKGVILFPSSCCTVWCVGYFSCHEVSAVSSIQVTWIPLGGS